MNNSSPLVERTVGLLSATPMETKLGLWRGLKATDNPTYLLAVSDLFKLLKDHALLRTYARRARGRAVKRVDCPSLRDERYLRSNPSKQSIN